MKKPPIGTPLQAVVGPDRMPLGPTPVLGPKSAAAAVLAAYLGQLRFLVGGCGKEHQPFRLEEIYPDWPDPGTKLKYPSASISEVTWEEEAHALGPTCLEETFGCYGDGLVLWKTAETVVDFQVDFWTDTEAARRAIEASLPRAFSPTEDRIGILLAGSPDYFDRAVRCTLGTHQTFDTADSVLERERRLRTIVRCEVDSVHLRQATPLEIKPTW